MKKGIVLEVHDDYVTMLTPDGEFLKSRKQRGQLDIGEETIFFPLHMGAEEKGKLASFFKMKWAIVTLLTATVLILSFYPKYINNQVYAYVSLDVNPSLELGLNKNMKVISIDAFNDEGKLLLPRLGKWKNEDLSKVSSDIMQLIRQDGYLKSSANVVIASVLTDSENLVWKKKIQNELSSISENIQEDNVIVTTIETTNEKRDEAIKQGISPGKFVQNERKMELVDTDDTSKATEESAELQVVPSKATGVGQLQGKTGQEKPDLPVAVHNNGWKDTERNQERKHQHDEAKEQRKQQHDEAKEQRKHQHEEAKEQRKDDRDKMKEEKKEHREKEKEKKQEQKEERKQEREQLREERKKEQNQRKEDKKQDRGKQKQPNKDKKNGNNKD